jgi:hypothetical protein
VRGSLQVRIAKLEKQISQEGLHTGKVLHCKIQFSIIFGRLHSTGIVRNTNSATDREEKSMIVVLHEQINKLKSDNAGLKEKVKAVTEKCAKLKRDSDLVKQTAYLHKQKPGSTREKLTITEIDVVPAPNPRQSTSSISNRQPLPPAAPSDALGDTNLIEVARSYKARWDYVHSDYMTMSNRVFEQSHWRRGASRAAKGGKCEAAQCSQRF